MQITTKKLLRWSPVLLFAVALAVFLALFARYQRKPIIYSLDQLAAGPGDRLEITGRYFGDGLDGAKLLVGGYALTSTGILEWEDKRILARMPRSNGAVLVKVKTRSGTSDGVILGDSGRFPAVDYGPWLPGAPYIEYADPSTAGPGTLVTITGSGFGDRRDSGKIWVNRTGESSFHGMEAPDLSQYEEATFIEEWSENTVRFRVPQGAAGGNVYLEKAGFFSNPMPIEAADSPGSFLIGPSTRWSLRQEVLISRIGAFPGNSLYINLPDPQPGPGQGTPVLLEGLDNRTVLPLRREEGLSLYRLDNLEPDSQRLISRQLVVSTKPISVEIRNSDIPPFDPGHPELKESLIGDDWILPDAVSQVAARETWGMNDVWTKSEALYTYLLDVLSWNEYPEIDHIPDIIRYGEADSRGYSFLFCSLARAAGVPSRPVSGILVLENGESQAWHWAEFWVEGLGWVPVDPTLGDQAPMLEGLKDDSDTAAFYFGGLEGRHIAFSRGILRTGARQMEPKTRIPGDVYSLQDTWEELSGNLESYRSSWPAPVVTATYSDG